MESRKIYNELEVDFEYFIKLALHKKIPWGSLTSLLIENQALNLKQLKFLNKMLLEELKASELKCQVLKSKCKCNSEFENSEGESKQKVAKNDYLDGQESFSEDEFIYHNDEEDSFDDCY